MAEGECQKNNYICCCSGSITSWRKSTLVLGFGTLFTLLVQVGLFSPWEAALSWGTGESKTRYIS